MNAVCPVLMNKGLSILVASTLWLFLWATAISPTVVAQMSYAESTDSQSRFHRTVQYLQDASPRLRGEFAAIALTHLIDGYLEEMQLAHGEVRSAGRAGES